MVVTSKETIVTKGGKNAAGLLPMRISGHAVAAFVGRTERGPLNRAITIRNYNHFRQIFGGHAPFSFVSHTVQHFFLHGGKSAVIVRIANRANKALIRIPAGDGWLELQASQPGSREFVRVSVDYDGLEEAPLSFNLVVQRLSRPGSHLVEDQEIFASASMDPDHERYIARLLSKSRLVELRGQPATHRPNATRPRHVGDPIPYLEAAVAGSDGVETTDYDVIGSNRESTGIFSLDAVARFDVLCLPPQPGRNHGITTFLAAERYCQQRRALLIWDPPSEWMAADEAIIGLRSSEFVGRHALTYFPWIRSRLERVGLPTRLPACGAIAGILSNKSTYGDWRQGSESDPLLKISLAPAVDVSEPQMRLLNRDGANVLRATRYGGAVFRGDVTLAPRDGAFRLWRRLNRRRLLLFILKSLQGAADQYIDIGAAAPELLEARVRQFFQELFERGALAGETARQAYVVRRMIRREQSADRQRLRIGFALGKPNEFLLYELRIDGADCQAVTVPVLEAEQLAG